MIGANMNQCSVKVRQASVICRIQSSITKAACAEFRVCTSARIYMFFRFWDQADMGRTIIISYLGYHHRYVCIRVRQEPLQPQGAGRRMWFHSDNFWDIANQVRSNSVQRIWLHGVPCIHWSWLGDICGSTKMPYYGGTHSSRPTWNSSRMYFNMVLHHACNFLETWPLTTPIYVTSKALYSTNRVGTLQHLSWSCRAHFKPNAKINAKSHW